MKKICDKCKEVVTLSELDIENCTLDEIIVSCSCENLVRFELEKPKKSFDIDVKVGDIFKRVDGALIRVEEVFEGADETRCELTIISGGDVHERRTLYTSVERFVNKKPQFVKNAKLFVFLKKLKTWAQTL